MIFVNMYGFEYSFQLELQSSNHGLKHAYEYMELFNEFCVIS